MRPLPLSVNERTLATATDSEPSPAARLSASATGTATRQASRIERKRTIGRKNYALARYDGSDRNVRNPLASRYALAAGVPEAGRDRPPMAPAHAFPSVSVRRAARGLRGRAGRLPVAEEALAGLAAQLAGVTEGDEPRRRCHPLLAERLAQVLARMHVHVDPDEIEKRARAERPAGAERERAVQVGGRHLSLVEHAHAVVEERDEHAVHDEAGRVAAADRLPAETLGERECRLHDLARRPLGADDLDERHQWRRVEEVQPERPLRPRELSGDRADRQRRRIGRQDRVRCADAFEVREDGPLDVELLEDGLDDQVARRELGEIGRERQAGEGHVAGRALELTLLHLAAEEARDARATFLGAHTVALVRERLEPRLDAELRDA